MDESKFDDILKNKLEQFPEEPFDPAALADLHYRMAMPQPLYVRYRAEFLTAAAVIIILLFNGLFYLLNNGSYQSLSDQIAHLQNQNQQLTQKQDLLLSRNQEVITDTLVIERDNPALLYEITLLRNKLDQLVLSSQNQEQLLRSNYHFLGYQEQLSEEMIQSLYRKGLIRYNGNEVWLAGQGNVPRAYAMPPDYFSPNPYSPNTSRYIPILTASEEVILPEPEQIDLRSLRELEKHYQKGVGLRIAPVFGTNFIFHEVGSGSPKVNFGAMADLIVSPSLSVESGLILNTMSNEIEDRSSLDELNKPDYDPTLGELTAYEIDTEILEFPLNLKYRHPIGSKTYLTSAIGYTAMLYTRQQIEYEQLYDAGDPIGIVNVGSGTTINDISFSPGTLNLYMGVSTRHKKRNFFEAGIQYRQGLGPMGVEEVKTNLLGFRAAYWFHVK